MSYEIREMSFGEILDMGFRLLRNHFVLLVGIAAVFYVPFGLAVSALVDPSGPAPGPEVLLGVLGAMLLTMAIVNPIVLAAITHAVGESYLGRAASIGGALRVGVSILLPLIGTSILAVLAELVGFALLVIPGVYLALAFILLQQVIVLERVFGFTALTRSHELMKGHKLRGFGILLVTSIIMMILSTALGLFAAFVPVLGPVLEAVGQSVGYAFMSAVLVVFYFDVRCRQEAFDLEHLARLVEEEAGVTPAPIG